jgi:hypothetical protein
MLRIIFALLVFIHGLIHLLGFVKEWKVAQVRQLSGEKLFPFGDALSKMLGIVWLVTFLCFAVAVAGFLATKDWWWMVAFTAVVISQALIILYWKDAWAGTILNVVLLPVIIVAYAEWGFDRSVQQEVESILGSSTSEPNVVVSKETLQPLPSCVQKWLERANVVGKPTIRSVRLKQKGMMRGKPEESWMPVEAEEYFRVDQPAFLWKARVQYRSLIQLVARDRYIDGRGNMLVKALSLISVADSKGKEIDQGSMVRYLAEMVWFPTAALRPYIRWEEIDSTAARATMSYRGITAQGIFRFTEDGDILTFEAERYREVNGKYSLDPWLIRAKGYRSFDGIRIPDTSEVTWKLPTGDFTWFEVEITDLEYNKPEMY